MLSTQGKLGTDQLMLNLCIRDLPDQPGTEAKSAEMHSCCFSISDLFGKGGGASGSFWLRSSDYGPKRAICFQKAPVRTMADMSVQDAARAVNAISSGGMSGGRASSALYHEPTEGLPSARNFEWC